MNRIGFSLALVAVSSTLAFVACGDDDDDGATPAAGGAPSQGGQSQGGSGDAGPCMEIAETCHPVDPGSGPLHECHEGAEQGDPTWCTANGESCLAQCRAAAEGGLGGDGGNASGGAGGSLGGAASAGAASGGAGGVQ